MFDVDRRWRRKLWVLGLVGLLAVLGACAGEEATPTATATTAAPVGQAPVATETVVAEVTATVEAPAYEVTRIGKYGGVLRWAVKAPWRGTDVLRLGSITDQAFLSPQFSGMTRFNPFERTGNINNIVPDLATSWEVEDAGKSYVFHLRENAYWHDGTQVTCQDVVTSWQHVIKPGGSWVAEFSEFFAGAECRDNFTPVFKLTAPLAKTMVSMSSGLGGTAIMQHKMLTSLGGPGTKKEVKPADVIGSGAYKVVSADVAAGWRSQRVDNFYLFDEAGNRLPYLDGVHAFGITDTGTRNASYLGGQLDAILGVTLEARSAIEILTQKPDHTVITVGGNDWGWTFGKKVAPFDNYNVRKAFHLAFDRHANVPITDPSPPGQRFGKVWGFVPPHYGGPTEEELNQMPGYRPDKTADIAEANRLLDEAGYPRGKNGIRFSIKTFAPVTQEYQDNAVLYSSDLLNIGIAFKLDLPIDNAEEGTRGTACDFQVQSRRGTEPLDADGNLPVVIAREGDAVYNCGWRTVEYLRDLWLEQSSTLDQVARKKKVHDLEMAYYEDKDIGHRHIQEHWGFYLTGHWPFVKGGGWDHPWFARMDHLRAYDVWIDKN